MRKAALLSLLVVCALMIHSIPTHAASVIMYDTGFLYTSGDFPYATVGDELGGVGFISSTIPGLNVDLTTNEMTWSLSELVVSDQFVVDTRVYTNFSGGRIVIYVDPSMNGTYGDGLLDPSVLISFEDGEPFLTGTITSGYMSYDMSRQYGVFAALVNFTTGTGLASLEEPNGNIVEFTFGPDDPNIPPGFLLQATGYISVPALCTVRGNVNFIYNPETCVKCEGITRLALRYSGPYDLSTAVVACGVQHEVAGDLLTITPGDPAGLLPGNTKITLGGEDTDIHTSCSRPIESGNVIGDFTVVIVDKVLIPCEEAGCDGMNRLVVRYHGIEDPSSVTLSDGAYAVVEGDLITILPTGDELKGNTTLTIGGNAVTIHTSCSQPLEPGFVFGEYEVVAVDEIYNGGGDGTSPTNGPVVGATIDLVDGEGNIHSTLTDENGDYVFFDVATQDISVSAVVPLGYYPITPTEVNLVCLPGDVGIVDFVFERLATQDKPRSTGFWKHQITSALQGKQKGVQVPAEMLLTYFDQIHTRFDQYFEIYTPVMTLEDFSIVMNLKKPTQYEKARKELAGLLLNVVSNRLSSWQFISHDQATVSQAITFVSDLIVSGNDGEFELAKDIAETINHNEIVDAGTIPLDIGYIAYYKGGNADVPGVIVSAENYPNPFNPATTIIYELKDAMPVTLTVYNVLGQKIRSLVQSEMRNGINHVRWDGTNDSGAPISSGVYFYRLKAGSEVVTRRMVLLR